MEQIENKIASSGLVTLDLEQFLPNVQEITELDIAPFLFKGLILKEQEFRTAIKEYDFSIFQDKIVGLFCSADAIIPMWAYMLLTSSLAGIAKEVRFGKKEELELQIALEHISNIDVAKYTDGKLILKGCGKRQISEAMYIATSEKLLPVVSSMMFGEPCSTVPVYKRKKS